MPVLLATLLSAVLSCNGDNPLNRDQIPEDNTQTEQENTDQTMMITPTTETGGFVSDYSRMRYYPGMQINVNDKTFSARLEEIAKAGFRHVELKFQFSYGLTDRSDAEINTTFASMQNQLQDKGISVWSVHLPYDDKTWNNIGGAEDIRKQSTEHLIRVMRLCAKNFPTCRNFVTHASKGVLSPRSESVNQAKKSLKEMSAAAKQLGVRICVENLVGSLCYSFSELESVCKDTPDVYYTFDIEHANCKGYDVVDFLTKEATKLGTVHIHDTIFDSGNDTHMLVGTGDISKWGEVYMTMLSVNRYRGVFMFEPKNEQSAEDVMKSYEFIVEKFKALKK